MNTLVKIVFFALSTTLVAGCVAKHEPVDKNTSVVTPKMKTTGDNRCADNFSVLQALDVSKFDSYRSQFGVINGDFYFYNKYKNVMDKDAKELMTMELSSKLNLVCARVKNSAYTELQKKMEVISSM